jgi:hypothetical protein
LTAGTVFGQFTGIFASFLPKVKWQLVTSCIIFTTFAGCMAASTQDNKGMAIAFTLIAATMDGYQEVITNGGGSEMVDPKAIGLANGVQYVIRSCFSTLTGTLQDVVLLTVYLSPA